MCSQHQRTDENQLCKNRNHLAASEASPKLLQNHLGAKTKPQTAHGPTAAPKAQGPTQCPNGERPSCRCKQHNVQPWVPSVKALAMDMRDQIMDECCIEIFFEQERIQKHPGRPKGPKLPRSKGCRVSHQTCWTQRSHKEGLRPTACKQR